ncbi:MAG: hypothetical protein ROO71_08945 [Balneola sp.]
MAINKTRLREYLKELKALQTEVGDTQFLKIFEERVLDALSRKLIDVDDVEYLQREIGQLFKIDFSKFDLKILQSYNTTLEIVNDLYDDLGGDIARQFAAMRALEKVHRLQLDSYADSTVKAIAKIVQKGALENQTYKEVAKSIKALNDDKASYYAETLAKTQIKRYGRQSRYQKALIGGVTIFLYTGVLGVNSRPFCRACFDKNFHIDDIKKMSNGMLDPVLLNAGGWNCVHEFEPHPSAKKADAVSGKIFKVTGGAKVFGDERTKKQFNFSIGADSFGGYKDIQKYVDKIRKLSLKGKRLDHIRGHYSDLEDRTIELKLRRIIDKPDNMYYQYNSGPRIVFERNGEFVFASARKFHTMFKPAGKNGAEAFQKNLVSLFVKLNSID